MQRFLRSTALAAALTLGAAGAAQATPSVLEVGTLYASSGNFASSSLPEYKGLAFWAEQVNAHGGVYVKAYGKRVPVKLVAYDDQSSTGTAGALYNQLLTRDRVPVLVSDFGSVLTSVAAPLAEEHHVLLLDPTGTSAKFFTGSYPNLVLTGLPGSAIWPEVLGRFLIAKGVKRVAVVYGANDFTGSQRDTLVHVLEAGGVKLVYDHSVPTNTSSYAMILHQAKAQGAQAMVELGYDNNDIAFLQDLASSGLHFQLAFAINPGLRVALFRKSVGDKALDYTYSYVTPPALEYDKVNYGLGLKDFDRRFAAWNRTHGNVPMGLSVVAGYNTGLVIEKAVAHSPSLKAADLRLTIQGFSGKLFTVDGSFKINAHGEQIGESIPLGQFIPQAGKAALKIVYPKKLAQTAARYPAPATP
ncbi:ABC transporter substrate-binding protein [Acidihalobacter prosperus]|uniref:Leucine-binding protein domain-containing protein n=1 Tax=Acidihalobacter prosperus TaxID=160660 RepID=A0A1A6C467_9GAMM|nr:ABC transporter substrate-binding protein [Acidihalobacter prosperus]OBS09335.1 hypothetical protein Thpro_021663 [Acidihalobacter prosperus]